MGLLLLLQEIILVLFRPTSEGCPEAFFKMDLLSIRRTNLQSMAPGAGSEYPLKDTGLCMCERAARVSVLTTGEMVLMV